MSEHIIRLPKSLYRSLLAAAEAKGLTPTSWIASQLSTSAETISIEVAQPLYEFPEDLIGSIDSGEEPVHVSEKTTFGELLKAKFEKQGLHFP